LRQVATIVTPDTILRRHRQLIVRKWTFEPKTPGRPGIMKDLSALIVRMATENPGLGYTRIQGALKNLGHGVARSTVAKVLKTNGIPPAPDRPSSWRTCLRAQWGAIAGADFFTSEVWTPRGLVTYYTLSGAAGSTWRARRPPRMRGSRRLPPFALLDHRGVGLEDQRAHPVQRLRTPVYL
jgi:putative transposase